MKKLIYLFSFFTLIISNYATYGAQAILDKEIKEIIKEANNIRSEIPTILAEAKKTINLTKEQIQEDRNKAKQEKTAKIKNQNTTFFTLNPFYNRLYKSSYTDLANIKLGFYKRDFIETSTFITDIWANYNLYNNLEKLREEFLVNSILKNSKKWEKELENCINSPSVINTYKLQNFILNQTKISLKERYNLFNKNSLCKPIITKLIVNAITDLIENKYIIKTPNPQLEKGFYKDNNNQLQAYNLTPISILTIIKILSNPSKSINNLFFPKLPKTENIIRFMNKAFNLHIPDIAFHKNSIKIFNLFFKISCLHCAITFYNQNENLTLANFISKNKSYLLNMLKEYNKADTQIDKDIIKIKMKEFIQNSNKSLVKKLFPIANYIQWTTCATVGQHQVKTLLSLPLIGYLGYKTIRWYRSL